jgi:hypothetical protein
MNEKIFMIELRSNKGLNEKKGGVELREIRRLNS